MMESIPSAAEEFFKILRLLRKADPIQQLMIAGVERVNHAAAMIINEAIHYLTVIEEVEQSCDSWDCVVREVERRTGEPLEVVTGALRAFRQLVLEIVVMSPNVRSLVYRSGEYILAGGMPEIRYNIGGFVKPRTDLEKVLPDAGEEL